jgi:adenine-specific DNA-methyltransferase
MKPSPTSQKLRGGYYTPQTIARFLCQWAIRKKDTRVLEPSCGNGNILLEAAEVLYKLAKSGKGVGTLLTGIELYEDEASCCVKRLRETGIDISRHNIIVGDFFLWYQNMNGNGLRFDAIVGNPPFIRYQNFSENQKELSIGIMNKAGLRPNRLMNAWVPFLIVSTKLLAEGGRLAMVIPAELLQVNYAAETRRFLSNNFSRIALITFRRLIFKDIQQEVVLLLGEKNGLERNVITAVEFDGIEDLISPKPFVIPQEELKPIDHSAEKWTQYFLESNEILLLRKLKKDPRIKRVSNYAEVDVGIVSGMNEFFVTNQEKLQEYKLSPYALPIVSRSAQLEGIVYSKCDWESDAEKNQRSFLLNFSKIPRGKVPDSVKEYVEYGEKNRFHVGYKCRIRDPWYVVPSIWIPDAFMLRQVHKYPKIVLNRADATCTDTIHRVKFLFAFGKRAREHFTVAFLNSMTFAFSEVLGRSYGGGVLEMEPREAEALPIPFDEDMQLDYNEIDKLVSSGNIGAVLDITDKLLLKDKLGLTNEEIKMLRRIWEKMRNRRNERR